ncbi:hypothetical protein HDU84_000825 [Entophlyctis sp. JEL0112]|nr:hypothetical protein HDU84_000825 [Entophlyctis sp. JEL0112]
MSRGGFRGGRGGGRGGFGRGAQSSGLDIEGLDVSFHDIPLFPEMPLPAVFRRLTDSEKDALAFDKAWLADLKDSPYNLENPPVRDGGPRTVKGEISLDRIKEIEKEEQNQGKRTKTEIGLDEDGEELQNAEDYDEEGEEEADDYVNEYYDDDYDGVGGDDSDHGKRLVCFLRC